MKKRVKFGNLKESPRNPEDFAKPSSDHLTPQPDAKTRTLGASRSQTQTQMSPKRRHQKSDYIKEVEPTWLHLRQ